MFAARQRAAQMARQLPRAARSYASEAHGHHHQAAEVNESFGVRYQAAKKQKQKKTPKKNTTYFPILVAARTSRGAALLTDFR